MSKKREHYYNSIPPVSAYAHYNEEAEAVWYEENKYDMANPPEPDYDMESNPLTMTEDELEELDPSPDVDADGVPWDREPVDDYDPGPEVDDEGGMSEHRFVEDEL